MSTIEWELFECSCCKKAVHIEDGVGECNDGDCPYLKASMCNECATWYEDDRMWRCPSCAEEASCSVCESKQNGSECFRKTRIYRKQGKNTSS